MRDMTTAEFQKTKLEALQEPVRVRRYTKAVGTYYPEGYIAALPPSDPALIGTEYGPLAPVPGAALDLELVAAQKVIEQLEEDNKHLKKLLAAGAEKVSPPVGSELLSQERRTIPQHPMKDVFAGLAKQDREFFERKLGKPGKTK